jgi:hypothetical protein
MHHAMNPAARFLMFKKPCLCLLTFLLAACAHITPEDRRQNADTLAATHQWQKLPLPTKEFVLMAYVPPTAAVSDTLAIYIEGDGFAWITASQPSDDPTPRDPIGLKLAMRHSPGTAVYLGRPCQYVQTSDARGCDVEYWTGRRMAPEVIDATDQAIDALKLRFGTQKLILIGYSGGGGVAALVAAQRHDVTQLVTVAGNLDHAAWTTLHHVPPLNGSLNPADAWRELQHVRQVHFVGGKDNNVSVAVANSYAARFPAAKRPRIQIVPDADHSCCWVDHWPALLAAQLLSTD